MPDYQVPPWGRDTPPAPLTMVTVTWNGGSERVPALLDSGCDYTEIPTETATNVGCRKLSRKRIIQAGDEEKECQTYWANIEFAGRTFVRQIVVADDRFKVGERVYCLIGRDILNQAVVLDGPGLEFRV